MNSEEAETGKDPPRKTLRASVVECLARQSAGTLTAIGLLAVVVLGWVDYVTGWEVSFSIFYLLPISLVAWHAGLRCGIIVSIASAIAWLIAELLWPEVHGLIPYWNAAVRLGFFLIVTSALSSLRAAKEQQKELTEFIVHDLRSPLTNVLTGVRLLRSYDAEKLKESKDEILTMATISGDRVLTLIDSLLDISRLETGRMPAQPVDVSIGELVASAVDQVDLWAKHQHVAIFPEVEVSASPVHADPSLTQRVLVNLLSNALRFTPRDSAITLHVGQFDERTAVFTVQDQGPGIPREWAEKVFDKHAQVKARNAGASGGFGLGLTFCRLAVEAHGGQIWLSSKAGAGTQVSFTLPFAR